MQFSHQYHAATFIELHTNCVTAGPSGHVADPHLRIAMTHMVHQRSHPATHHRPVHFGYVLTGLSLGILLSQLGTNVVGVALLTFMQEFGASFAEVQWVVVAYLLTVTALIVGVGRFADQLGKKKLYLGGLICFVAASMVCALAPNLMVLIVGRGIQGLGGAIIMALSFAFVGEIIPKNRIGLAMGVLSMMVAFGIALGPSLGSLALLTFGWRAMFWMNLPLGLLTYILLDRHLPRAAGVAERVHSPVNFDWLGMIALSFTLFAYCVAMTLSGSQGIDSPLFLPCLTGAVLGLALFLAIEIKVRRPLLSLSLFRDRLLSTSMMISVLAYAVMMATLVLGPIFLTRGIGLDTRTTGLIMTVGPLTSAMMSVPAGWLSDRAGPRLALLSGLTLMTTGSTLMSMITIDHGARDYIASIIPISLGLALFQTPNNTAVMSVARPEQRGLVSALLALGRNLGLITGASLMGAIFNATGGQARPASGEASATMHAAITLGMQSTFRVAALLAGCALILALAGFRQRTGDRMPK
ncbi:MFS transporter [Rhizobium sp. SG570]|uniref:MFS transporter n=1 Tax=Rhizobium sp. SG570 TaxID=2587113 RepID=UPI0011A4819F|nr:MFS transporter [Rhizobium sp. SG570]NKJ40186.1 EmrB/QacA subfamily drug resistance transporter [Rhizobium sp. SG570]